VESRNPLCVLVKKWAVLRHRFWCVVTGADIPLSCQIEGGLLLPHQNGIVIHQRARIGPNCLIFQQVTIDTRRGETMLPVIGDHASIGANAVVLKDVLAGKTAVGIPAVIVGS